jgi:hypothetical protein
VDRPVPIGIIHRRGGCDTQLAAIESVDHGVHGSDTRSVREQAAIAKSRLDARTMKGFEIHARRVQMDGATRLAAKK